MAFGPQAQRNVQISPPLNYRLPLTEDPGLAKLLAAIDDADAAFRLRRGLARG